MNGHGTSVHSNMHNNPEKPKFDIHHQGGMTFAFRKRWGQLDWRKLASVDVDRIAKEMDFQALQQNIMNITFCNIETEEFHNVDPTFIKVFRLSQLTIEYLLHSQQYLSSHSTSLQQQLVQLHQEYDKAMNDFKSREEELKALKKENRKRRKVIEAYQDMINAGATGLHTCTVCKREFVSSEYLLSHMHRRHPNHLPKTDTDEKVADQSKVSQEEMEARLLEQMTQRLSVSEKQLREEMKQKEQETMNLHIKDFEDWKEKERERMKLEVEEFKRPIIAELESLQKENASLERSLQDKEAELLQAQSKRQSHLGHLDGAKELILDEANESRAEIGRIKESLELQLQDMQAALKRQDQSWRVRMKKLSVSYQDQLAESVSKLDALEQSFQEGTQSDKDKALSKKLKLLQQKMKQQEEVLHSQQDQLAVLQSREPSPVPPEHIPPANKDEIACPGDSDGDSSSDDDYTDFGHTDVARFSPFPNHPLIKTKYDHNHDDIQKIRRQSEAIFSETLAQRGISKDMTGLKNNDFEQKMRILQLEQQQKIQTHYHFAEHRQSVASSVDEMTTDYRPVPTTQKPQPSPRQKSNASSKALGRPPIPTPVAVSPQTGIQSEVKPSINKSEEQDKSGSEDSLASISAVSSEDISDSTISSIQGHANDQPNVAVVITDTAASPKDAVVKVKEQKKNSSWDSGSDSFDDIVPARSGRTSSTPIKAFDKQATKSAGHKLQPLDNVSLDSFDLSSSDPVPAPLQVDPAPLTGKNSKLPSATATSQSALTSVSMDDFDSDLDISDLT